MTVGADASLEVCEGKVNTLPHPEGTADSDPAHKAAWTCVKENGAGRAKRGRPALPASPTRVCAGVAGCGRAIVWFGGGLCPAEAGGLGRDVPP